MSSSLKNAVETHQEQLERLKAEVTALREQVKRAQRLAAVGTMTAMVAHEFNNILTPIINYAQLAQTNPALSAKAIASAADGGARATSICQAIMGIARGDAAGPARDVNVAQLLEQTLNAMAREPAKDRIAMDIDAPPDLMVKARKVELQQVLLNLIMNARAAVMSKSGQRTMSICVRSTGRHVEIRVADNGVGIPPENLDKIFLPFFTTKPVEGEGKGSGLGLAICKDIITDMDGSISVHSMVGQGSTFTVRLPV